MSQGRRKTQPSSRLLLTIFLIENLLLALLALSSCVTEMPKMMLDGPVYFGDSSDQTLFSTGHSSIRCTDPLFEELICIQRKDFEKIIVR